MSNSVYVDEGHIFVHIAQMDHYTFEIVLSKNTEQNFLPETLF